MHAIHRWPTHVIRNIFGCIRLDAKTDYGVYVQWAQGICRVSSQQCSCHWSKTSARAGMYQELLLLPGLVAKHSLGLLDMGHIPFAQSNYFLSCVKRGNLSENRVASCHRQREKKRLNLCLAPFVSAYTVNCHVIQVEKKVLCSHDCTNVYINHVFLGFLWSTILKTN